MATITVTIVFRGVPDNFSPDDIKFGVGALLARLPESVRAKVTKIKRWKTPSKKTKPT